MNLRTALIASCIALSGHLVANNIQVSNVTIADQDSVTQTANIVFDVSWENSWRLSTGPANWDAAWIFVKYHNGDNQWRHAKLSVNAADHIKPAAASLSVGTTDDIGLGIFLHRADDGAGDVSYQNVKLKWDYGADNILDTAIITADVQAIEMVYVPEGAFYLGDGGSSGSFCRGDDRSKPYQVTSAGTLEVGGGAGQFGGRTYSSSGGALSIQPVAASVYPSVFPNGYNAFYCMKYEVSQGQFRSAATRGLNAAFVAITGTTSRQVNATASPNRAYMTSSVDQILRYLSWSGLRPMTSMEYEKSCRGPVFPVPGEHAWGTAVVANEPYTLSGDGTDAEAPTNANPNAGNAWSSSTIGSNGFGPCRVGMFAFGSYEGTTSPRIQAGATYWGIMDMTGNGMEPVVRELGANRWFGAIPPSAEDLPDLVEHEGTYYQYSRISFRASHGNGTSTIPLDWPNGFISFSGGSYSPSLRSISSSLSGFDTSRSAIRGVRNAP